VRGLGFPGVSMIQVTHNKECHKESVWVQQVMLPPGDTIIAFGGHLCRVLGNLGIGVILEGSGFGFGV
jgi:hypothetical protein